MSRWMNRAAEILADTGTSSTDKTANSQLDQVDEQLLSAVSGPPALACTEIQRLVSVLASPATSLSETLRSPDWCDWYSHGWIWREIEIQRFMVRRVHFRKLKVTEQQANILADRLVERDREEDDRRLCVECRNCRPGLRCTKHLVVLSILQRCDQFTHCELP